MYHDSKEQIMLELTYFSHSSFMLFDGKHRLLIDPFFSGNPTSPVKRSDIKADFIVLTHAHGDHLGDALVIARDCDATIIAVNELANYCSSQGLRAHNMHIGGGYNFDFGRVKFTIAHHGSCLPGGEYMGPAAGVVITMGGKKTYHTGDTGLFLDMKLIGELDTIDYMLLPIGDNFTMGVADAAKAVEFVRPALAVPIHYNTFSVIMADPHEFVRRVEHQGQNARVMEYGATIKVD
jgi:L-ascorbate metabolism protein UlaG (beta-lactamase superfamily)